MRELTYHNSLVIKRPNTNVEISLGKEIKELKADMYKNIV